MKQPLMVTLSLLMIVGTSSFYSGMASSAPLIDVSAKVGQWQTDYSGELGVGVNITSPEELGFDDDNHNVFTLVFQHSLPFIPNAKIWHSDILTNANGTLVRNLEFDNIIFVASEDVETKLDLTHTDFTLFYSPLSNWVQLDLGLTGRKFDSKGTISGSFSGTDSVTFDDWIPMLYAGTRFELPSTGLYADATLNIVGYDGNKVSDVTAAVGYAIDLPAVDIIAEIGYRKFSFKLNEEDNDIGIDLELDGLFFNVGFKF